MLSNKTGCDIRLMLNGFLPAAMVDRAVLATGGDKNLFGCVKGPKQYGRPFMY